MSNVTFVINWVDPIAEAVSVTFSTDSAETSWSIPVDKGNPDLWQQAISDWYRANLVPSSDTAKIVGEPLPLVPENMQNG